MILRAKNWGEFQHYKDRDPPWIKLHKRLLDDRKFHALPDASRALAPMVWLLCSESKDGTIKDAVQEIGFRLRMTEKRVDEALKPLIDAGFFQVEQDDSAALAPCEHDATQRQSRDRDREEEEDAAFDLFLKAAKKHGWSEPRGLAPDRRRKLRARLDEHGIDGWTQMLALAGASEFLTGKWPLKFDWVLEPKNFRKVIEGNYTPNQHSAPSKGRVADALPPEAPWEARMRGWWKSKFWQRDWGPTPDQPGCWVPASLRSAA